MCSPDVPPERCVRPERPVGPPGRPEPPAGRSRRRCRRPGRQRRGRQPRGRRREVGSGGVGGEVGSGGVGVRAGRGGVAVGVGPGRVGVWVGSGVGDGGLDRVAGRRRVGGPAGICRDGSQPVDRAGQGELGGAEPFDEVAAPGGTRSSSAASTGYTPANPPGRPSAITAPRVTTPCRSSSRSAVTAARRVGSSVALRQPVPAAGAARRPARSGSAAGPAGGTGTRLGVAWPCARPPRLSSAAQRRQRVVGDLAGPDQIPQGGEQRRLRRLPAIRSARLRKNSAWPSPSASRTASCSGVAPASGRAAASSSGAFSA